MLGLRFEHPVATDSALYLEGKEVGRVTSSVMSPRLGAIGVAILHNSAWTPGTTLVAADDIKAIVSEIPFDK